MFERKDAKGQRRREESRFCGRESPGSEAAEKRTEAVRKKLRQAGEISGKASGGGSIFLCFQNERRMGSAVELRLEAAFGVWHESSPGFVQSANPGGFSHVRVHTAQEPCFDGGNCETKSDFERRRSRARTDFA